MLSSRANVLCFCRWAADEQVDDRLLAALRVMFSRSKQELEGKTAKQLGKYKVCNSRFKKQNKHLQKFVFTGSPGSTTDVYARRGNEKQPTHREYQAWIIFVSHQWIVGRRPAIVRVGGFFRCTLVVVH